MLSKIFQFFILPVLFLLTACGGSGGGAQNEETSTPSTERSFYMGFTPWPYAATTGAITNTYSLIQEYGDIVSHHLQVGIPWEEAYMGAPFPDHTENEISSMINQTVSGKVIFLSIDSLNTARDDLAPNWGASGQEARSTPWDALSFNDPEVIEAYTKFALDMIERFNPSYFNYAPEVSELILNAEKNNTEKFDQFVTFAGTVYQNIKAQHPDLPLMVSVALKSPGSDDSATIESNFPQISSYVDIVGISVYPYAFYEHSDKGDPSNLPNGWLTQISTIAGSKPVAISETGWIAESLTIDSYGYSEQSDASKQSGYVSELLSQANELSMEFVIWFTIVDYDALWNDILGQDDLSKIWRDTGLYDESLYQRPAFDVWNQYYLRDKI